MGGTDFASGWVRCFSHRSVKRLTHRCVNQLEQTVCLIALCGDKVKMKAKLEYIWLDGYMPTQSLRSKTLSGPFWRTLEECPMWSFDGSSTEQADGSSSDCLLKPVAIFPDPGRKDALVMTEV